MANLVRILIVEDHDLLRTGLSISIQMQRDFVLVGEARTVEAALDLCARLQPDVVLMDPMLPGMDGMDGIAAIEALRRIQPRVCIIVLTSYVTRTLVQHALRAGATSYLLKSIGVETLMTAIRDAMQGRSTLGREAAEAIIHAAQQPAFVLTPREREVLRLMVEGANNSEISERLFIGLSTTKKYVSSILKKLGASNRTEAVAIALRHNLVAD
jgi:NarL family two-component system response regulator LiaR